jgi:transcriptional regulator with XRE-family HTH domain
MAFKQTDIKLHIKEYLSMSSKEFAAQIGVTEVTASNLINNKTTPSIGTLYKIAKVLGVSVVQLLGEETEEAKTNTDFVAFIRYKGIHYTADTLEEFNTIVEEIKSISK